MSFNHKECKNLIEAIDYMEENVRYEVFEGGDKIGEIGKVTGAFEYVNYFFPNSFIDGFEIVGFANTKYFFHDIPVVFCKDDGRIYLVTRHYPELFAYEEIEENYNIYTLEELKNWEE